MKRLLRSDGVIEDIRSELTLANLQIFCGGFIRFISLPSGDTMVVNEASADYAPRNDYASRIAEQPIYGEVIHCSPGEIV